MTSFDQFRNLVTEDLSTTNQPYEPDMGSGFRNVRQELGIGGYQFSLPTVDRKYYYCPEDGWYYSGPYSQGRGSTLQEAITQAQEPVST